MKTKVCTKCKVEKDISNFVKDNGTKDKLFNWCKECQKIVRQKWEKENLKQNPWYNSYNGAKQRCENPNNPNYFWWGGKGIKFLLTQEECAFIWNRDNAKDMKFPTIDRKDSNGNYCLENCQFLENIDNSMKDNIGHWYKGKYIKYCKIGQYTKDGKLIKIWNSQREISREKKYDQSSLSKAIKNNNIAYGFYWRKQDEKIQ